jgi:type 1 glutamine amidotransferase
MVIIPFRQCALVAWGIVMLAAAMPGISVQAAAAKFTVLAIHSSDDYTYHRTPGEMGTALVKEYAALDNYTVVDIDNSSKLTQELAASCQVICWFCGSPSSMPAAQRTIFENFIKSGKGFVGVHSATLGSWTWYMNDFFDGVTFWGHPATQQNGTVNMDPAASTHPIMQGVPSQFTVFEEWYSFNGGAIRGKPGITILATLDEKSYNPGGLNMGDHHIAWTSTKYGRMFFTGLGHTTQVWNNANHKQMIRNAVIWASGSSTSVNEQAATSTVKNGLPSYTLKSEGGRIVLMMPRVDWVRMALIDARGSVIAHTDGVDGICRLERKGIGTGVFFIRVDYPCGAFTQRVAIGQ